MDKLIKSVNIKTKFIYIVCDVMSVHRLLQQYYHQSYIIGIGKRLWHMYFNAI